MSWPARSLGRSTIVAPLAASGSALARVRFQIDTGWPAFKRRSAIGKPMRPMPIQPSECFAVILSSPSSSLPGSIAIGDRQFLRRKQRDDLAALVGDDDFFLDARGRKAVSRRAIGL